MSQQIQQRDGYSQLAMDLLVKAKHSGATEADIIIAEGETFSGQVRLGAVDRLTKAREKHLGLRVFSGKRSASTSTSHDWSIPTGGDCAVDRQSTGHLQANSSTSSTAPEQLNPAPKADIHQKPPGAPCVKARCKT